MPAGPNFFRFADDIELESLLADQGFVQASSPPAIAKWFRRSQGKAMAILSLSSAAGGVVLPLLVDLVMRVWHWRVAWVMLGGMMCVLGLLPCVFLVQRQPEDLGLPLDGVTASPHAEPSPSPYGPTGHTAPKRSTASWRLGEALHTPALWFLLVTAFAIGVSSTGIGLHLVPYLQQQGIPQTAAVQTVSLGFLASGVSNLVWGLSADRLPVRHLLVGTYALKTVSLAVLLGAHTVPEAYLFTVLQGIATGGLSTLTAILLAEYYGRQHLRSHLWPAQGPPGDRVCLGPPHCRGDLRSHPELSWCVHDLSGLEPRRHRVDWPGATTQAHMSGRMSLEHFHPFSLRRRFERGVRVFVS